MRIINKVKAMMAATGLFMLANMANAAVTYPALDIQMLNGDTGLTQVGSTVSIDATAFAVILDPDPSVDSILIPEQTFSLTADTNTGAGSLSIGNAGGIVVNGSFSNFILIDIGAGMGNFVADITFTGLDYGADMTDWGADLGITSQWLATGRLEGGFSPVSLAAKLGSLELQPVPVPAAVWLFGSGLLGLAGIAQRKSA